MTEVVVGSGMDEKYAVQSKELHVHLILSE